ncbi:MAG: iron-sulfur cluster repair di-iron protein [Luteolibacter sp.]
MAHAHHPNIITPPGTALPDRTVGELVAERPGRSRVFQAFQIDFCCQGGRTLREACDRKSADLAVVISELESESLSPTEPQSNSAELAPAELCEYIVEAHHGYLRRELPRIHAMAQRVAHVHGGHTPSLLEIFEVFDGLATELGEHMMKEEQVLFPAVRALASGEDTPMPLDGPIECMIHEHDVAGQALARLRLLTNAYQPPAEACNTYRALFDGLADLEKDLHRHIHLENNVLFPAAIAMGEVRETVRCC